VNPPFLFYFYIFNGVFTRRIIINLTFIAKKV